MKSVNLSSKKANMKINLYTKSLLLIIAAIIFFNTSLFGQAVGDYQTRAVGNWGNSNTWERYNGTGWVNDATYPGQNSGTGTVTITNNVTLNVSPANSIGSLDIRANLTPNNSNRQLTITDDFSISVGTFSFSQNNGRVTTVYIGGDFIMTGGTITENSNASGAIILNGITEQNFSKTGGTISNTINFTVNTGSTINMGTSVLDGSSGTFNLNSSAGIITAHADGISATGTNSGSIQLTGTRIFSVGANYTYNASAAQVSGDGLPATVNNLTINNSDVNGLTLTNSVVVNGILNLQQNPFILDGNTLTLNGTIFSTTGTISGNPLSTINVTGSGALGTLFFTPGSENLLNFSVNRTSGTVGLGTNLTIGTSATGSLTLTEGIIDPASNIITLANVAAGQLFGGSETAFINGSFQRFLPSSTSGSSNFLFPVGEGGVYKGLELIDITTGIGSVDAIVSVSANGATTDDGSTIESIQPRNWYVNSTGNLENAFVRITESGLLTTNVLGISTAAQSGTYISAGGIGGATITSNPAVTNFPAWFAIGTSNTTTYYSYQDGDWNTPTTWTLDPSGTLQVGNDIPDNGDFVVILSGRTVTLSTDINSTGLNLTINAASFLDMSTYQFTNTLLSLSGNGTLRLASTNFPQATVNTFIDTGCGTTEYNNTSNFTLPITQLVYNNLNINTTGGVIATQFSNLTLNGNLHVKQGNYRINDNTSATKLSITIEGNVLVDNGAFISVGNGTTNTTIGGTGGTAPLLNYYTNFHTVIIKGDLTNNGTVRFTNLDYPIYNAFPPLASTGTSGAASVYFQGNNNNTITCNGITDFYNLIVDKGFDQTYKLTINSTSNANFKLFGANTLAYDVGGTASNPDLRKALWIRSGTLILKGSVIIPSLSEGTAANANYYIPSNAALRIDGSDVIVLSTADDYGEVNQAYGVSGGIGLVNGVGLGGNSGLYVYGKLQIDNGYLSARESEGIVTSNVASGQVIINGGTVDAKQFHSLTGSSASYFQTGGTLILRGRFQRNIAYSSIADLKSNPSINTSRVTNGINTAYGSFNLDNTSNIFSMSGGTIRIYDVTDATTQEAFDVNSDLANINVTGGTLDIRPTSGTDLADANYNINSTSVLGNLTINRASGSSLVGLETNPLSILNNFTITAGDFDANNLNLTIGGNFSVANGTSYTSGTNTTTFNGSESQTFTINTVAAFSLNNFTIRKAAGTSVSFAGTQNTINVANEFRLELATLNDNGNTINVLGNVYNSGLHTGAGKIVLKGTNTQTIDGNGIFGNLELNNTNGDTAPVSLIANTTVNGTLNLLSDKIFNIASYNLNIASSGSISATTFSNLCYIRTSGNSGDGGLTKVYSTTTAFLFPLGVSNYTPASIGLSGAPTTYGSITLKPVNYEHPNVTAISRSLNYFWRVQSTGFTLGTATVTHSYKYDDANIIEVGDVSENEYVAARFDATTNTWTNGDDTDVDEAGNIIGEPGTGSFLENVPFIDGDYTAGDNIGDNPFGTPLVFYSRQTGLWSSTNTWSTDAILKHTGATDGRVPGARDIVIIGGLDSVYVSIYANNTERNIIDKDFAAAASLQIEVGSALDIGYNPGCIFSMVLNHPNGNGNFRVTTRYTSPGNFIFPTGDFSEFNTNLGTTELYTTNGTAGGTYWLPNGTSTYGNLIISPLGGSNIIFPNNDLTIYGDLITRGQNSDSWFCPTWNSNYPTAPTARIAKTITIDGDFRIEGGALVYYGNNNLAQNFIVNGDLFINEPAGLQVYSNATNQSISIGGSLINNSLAPAAAPNDCRGADFTDIPLTFFGNDNASIENTNTGQSPYTVLELVTVNKGTSQATTLACTIGGTLTVPTPANNWLTLQNGTFIYNRTGNLGISTTTDLTIPITAGLTINTPSNVYIANNAANGEVLFLNGKLTVQNGNVYIGPTNNTTNNADIEYSGLNAEIEVTGGNLFVNGQIRRPASTTNGTLKYTQSGGNVVIMGNNALVTKAKLEVLNADSEFNMSGGTLNIVRGGGTTFGDLYLRPITSSVTGGDIVFSQVPTVGQAVTGNQNYLLDANLALNNLSVTGTASTASLDLSINPLILKGDLTISNITSFLNTNNLNVTINGDFINEGNYNYGTNLTKFSGSVQTITGSSITNFYDLNVSPSSSLTVNSNFTVDNDLLISSGNLVLAASKLTLLGNFTNNGSYTDDNNTGGVSLSGPSIQQITGIGAYGRLELNNSSGANLNNDISVQGNFVLTSGILNINSYLLTLSQNSSILGAPFSLGKMIKSDGVASSNGIRKFFPKISAPESFTFPVGVSGKYTPAIYNIDASLTVGAINVNPINTYHPTVTDPNNVLQYYWEIESSGISGFNGVLKLQYIPTDVKGTETDYIDARLEIPGDFWYKVGIENVDEILHQITFTSTGSSNLSADYTAGNPTAIPDQVPSYISNQDGDWSDNTIWTPIGTAPPCPIGGPNGAIVIIDHIVYTSNNYSSAYRTTINNELQIIAPTFGHNLGTVSGLNGTLYIETGNLPAGNYAEFLDCTGNGTLNYGGAGSYTNIASLYNTVPNLIFSGTGTRTLYNKDLTICNKLVIDGPTLDNSVNNKKFTIGGSMEIYNFGKFISGTGMAPASTVTFAGTAIQSIGGPTGDFTGENSFNNLEIDNPAGLNIGVNGTVDVSNNLLLTNGIINTSTTNTLTVSNTSTSAVIPTGGSATSFVNGPLTKQITNGDDFIFPLGKGTVKGHNFTLISDAGSTLYWTAEFFTPNLTATSLTAPLLSSNAMEYWSASTSASVNAKVKIDWDAQSNLTAAMTEDGLSDMRVAYYNGSTWNEIGSTPSGTLSEGSVITTDNVSVSTTPTDYTTASITITTPSARLSPIGPVCGNVGIPITFTSFAPISLPYTLDYEIDGVPQTQIVINSLPYTLPTLVQGAYKLTDFTYTDGTVETGIVDNAIVNAYDVPTTAAAGDNQDLCAVSGTILDGNNPTPYTGVWSIISGTGGTIVNNNSMNSVFTGVLDESYTLRWTISNFVCTSSDDVDIVFNISPARPSDFIAALTPVCLESTGNVYGVTNDITVTYNWNYTSSGATINGTGSSVTIDFDASATDGIVEVTAENSCGISAARTISIEVIPRGSWLGDYSTDWFDVRNWTCPGIPLANTDVTIPNGANFMPEIAVPGAECNNLTIESGASLTISGSNNFDVYGDWTNDSGFSTTSTSTVSFLGSTVISGTSTNNFGNVVIVGSLTAPSGNVNIAGDLIINGSFNHNNGTVFFNGTAQRITGNAGVLTFNNLIINSGSDVSVTAGSQITILSDTEIQGDFTLESPADDGPIASFIDNGISDNSGLAHVQRHLILKQSHYITSPILTPDLDAGSNAKSDLFTSFGSSYNPNFYWYDESVDLDGNPITAPAGYDPTDMGPGWTFLQRYSTDAVVDMVNKQGYSFYGDKNGHVTFNGKLNTGDMSVSGLSYNDNDPTIAPPSFFDGWHLVGNPYPSSIDWDLINVGLTNLDNAIYVWDGANNRYAAYVDGIGTNGQTSIISAMQGFFVHANATGAGFTLNNSHRVHSATTTFKSAKVKSAPSEIVRLKVITNTGKSDETVMYFNPNATEEFDIKLDAFAKFSWNTKTYPDYYNYEDIPNLYSITNEGGAVMSINALPDANKEGLVVPVGLRLGTSGIVTISKQDFQITNTNVYLVDKYENNSTFLNVENEYQFNFVKGDVKDRFELRFALNRAPIVNFPITKKQINEESLFTYTFPENTFIELDEGDQIVKYMATLSDGSSLPSWLNFNTEERKFSGIPTNDDVAVLTIRLKAMDVSGGIGNHDFELEVININNAPELITEIPDQKTYEGNSYSYTIPSNTFNDIDFGDELKLSAKQANGSSLPEWLKFDYVTGRLFGTSENSGDLNILVTATDKSGATVSDEFILTVKSTTGVNNLSESEIILYPNPTEGVFFVKTNYYSNDIDIIVMDFNGKIIRQVKPSGLKTEIDISEFASGLYFIEISNEEESKVFKINMTK
ncbi:MAG: T9SS type A sorting domain-containing protein [Bacteroidales bacterium]|nr:T9SS type A sorting domain-containing protein [Bacteroidales bacterium]